MTLAISEKAEADLDSMDEVLCKFFIKHMDKIEKMPPRRHMRFGLPYFVEDITKQARMIYGVEGEKLIVLR